MTSYVTHTIVDHSNQRSFTRHYLPQINASNHDETAGNGVGQNVGNLRLSLADMTDGNFVKHEVTAESVRDGIFSATDENAQRELKLLLRCVDASTNRFTIEIPCPDLSILADPGTDKVLETSPEWAALIAALLPMRSAAGVAFTVLEGRIVGRRL